MGLPASFPRGLSSRQTSSRASPNISAGYRERVTSARVPTVGCPHLGVPKRGAEINPTPRLNKQRLPRVPEAFELLELNRPRLRGSTHRPGHAFMSRRGRCAPSDPPPRAAAPGARAPPCPRCAACWAFRGSPGQPTCGGHRPDNSRHPQLTQPPPPPLPSPQAEEGNWGRGGAGAPRRGRESPGTRGDVESGARARDLLQEPSSEKSGTCWHLGSIFWIGDRGQWMGEGRGGFAQEAGDLSPADPTSLPRPNSPAIASRRSGVP